MGEYYFCAIGVLNICNSSVIIKNDSFLLSREEERWGVLDDLKKDIEQKISIIKGYADRLYLNLSSNIKYTIE